jgi:hypothetical protein
MLLLTDDPKSQKKSKPFLEAPWSLKLSSVQRNKRKQQPKQFATGASKTCRIAPKSNSDQSKIITSARFLILTTAFPTFLGYLLFFTNATRRIQQPNQQSILPPLSYILHDTPCSIS